MKALVSLWNFLSIPTFLVALFLGWWGWKHWAAASALARPVTAAELERQTSGTFWVRDSFDYDLASPGLREENFYGFRQPARAVFPARPVSDTAPSAGTPPVSRFGVTSPDPRFVGPAVATFLRPDSMAVVDIKVSSTTSKHSGNIGPEMQALVQLTADRLGAAPLALPRQGRAWIEGLAILKDSSEIPDLIHPAPRVWEIRTGEQPGTGTVLLAFAAALSLIALFFGLNLVAKNWQKAELEREMAELGEQKGLV